MKVTRALFLYVFVRAVRHTQLFLANSPYVCCRQVQAYYKQKHAVNQINANAHANGQPIQVKQNHVLKA